MRAKLLQFIEALRSAGLSPTVAETLDALTAVGHVGVEETALREALAAALVKDHAERVLFDTIFDQFFAIPRRPRRRGEAPQQAGAGVGGGRGDGSETGHRRPPAEPREAPVRRGPRETDRKRQAANRPDADAASRLAGAKALQNRPFELMDPGEIEACDALVEELGRRFRAHLRRRLRTASRGRLDVRRTIRRSIATGGVMIEPAFRYRRPGRPDLVALCDYSHSVVTASRFFTALLLRARHFFRRVRVFAYVDEPTEVSFHEGHLVPHAALDLYARSDFGRVLVALWARHEALFTRNTVVLILGDARNNRRPPRADMLSRMRTLVRRVVWLNPESPERWNTGDSVIRSYAPVCDGVLQAGTVRELLVALRTAFRRP